MQNNIVKFFQDNFSKLPKSIAVAVSGGIDSMALTFLLQEFCLKNKIKLYAVTIDHKMRKTSSKEALQLNKLLTKNKISHQILAIDNKILPQSNIEAKLREFRYKLLNDFCVKNKITNLFLGHHQGDVAENFLIRLFRGSQLDGLSAIQETLQYKQIKLCRPLLATTKDELEKYLCDKKIKWFEDKTNDDEKFLRNKIRKFFAQFEDKNLIQKRIQNAAQNISESRDLLDEILLEKAKNCLEFTQEKNFIINLKEYKKIPPKIAQKLLGLVLIELSEKPYKPRLEGLKNFEKNIFLLQKNQKKNFYNCMAKILANNYVLIYREKAFDPNKFSFNTILGRIFNSRNLKKT